ncbi:hypothetical protein SHL15_6679 [Streptomyces hygroscopicus subsp. limoneus]|nr:hypothetical protein SHL15_6679 [Streptomyces hygroscopicus subsp. limoneus]
MPNVDHRTLTIELDGVLRQVPGQYHQTGPLVGRMITEPWFRAECEYIGGENPQPVRMALHRPLASTDPRLVVVDSAGSSWVLSFRVCHNSRLCRITGFY